MKITKYPQSCLIVEKDGHRFVIDPGSFVSEKYQVRDLLPLDFILITHEHSDHVDQQFLKEIIKVKPIPVIANQSTANLLEGSVTNIIRDKDEISMSGFNIIARDLPHVLMVDGTPGPQNTGFIIDGIFFHPGDGMEISEVKVDYAAVPIAGPDISPHDIYQFIKDINAKTVIPIHYDFFKGDLEILSNKNFFPDTKFLILENGQSTEI